MAYPFLVGNEYTKKDIYKIIGVSVDTHGGNWDTGYNRYLNDFFIFSNVSVAGRTGHDYNNHFHGGLFYWMAKSKTTLEQPQIQQLLNPPGVVYIFFRFDNTRPWIFAGTGIPVSSQDTTPVEIVWKINKNNSVHAYSDIDYYSSPQMIMEGEKRTTLANTYERNPVARKQCIDFWGYRCMVCGFNFEKVYGEIGKEFIHVHHMKPLLEINDEYCVDPQNDLRPVCPNCHAMIHMKTPALTIEELKTILRKV